MASDQATDGPLLASRVRRARREWATWGPRGEYGPRSADNGGRVEHRAMELFDDFGDNESERVHDGSAQR